MKTNVYKFVDNLRLIQKHVVTEDSESLKAWEEENPEYGYLGSYPDYTDSYMLAHRYKRKSRLVR